MDYANLKSLTPKEVKAILEEADLLWLYQGKPRKEAPHAKLTGGNHSDGFAMVGKLLKEDSIARMRLAEAIVATLLEKWKRNVDRVVGADTSSTDLAVDVAQILGAKHIRMMKIEDGSGKRQVWHPKNEPLTNGETILHIEELVTTSFSSIQVREGIKLANPIVGVAYVPYLPVIVERSNPDNRIVCVEKSKLLPLLQLDIRNYEPGSEHCPYCFVESEPLEPKKGDNWARLTGKK